MRPASEDQSSIQLSIIVPITRMHGRLGQVAKWLSEIDFSKVEVILVHDLQDEKTGIELRELISVHPMTRIIEQTFLSPGLARNAGLNVAQADWILFWDSDDDPNISVLHDFVEHSTKSNFDVYVFNFRIEKDGASTTVQTRNWRELALHPGIWRIVFSRATVFGQAFPDFPLGEDQHFLAQLELPYRGIKFIDANLYTYKIGIEGQATSRKSNILRINESLHALNKIRMRQEGDNFEFTSILLWRQIFTLLKRGNIVLKLQAMPFILGNILKPNYGFVMNLKALNFLFKRLVMRHG